MVFDEWSLAVELEISKEIRACNYEPRAVQQRNGGTMLAGCGGVWKKTKRNVLVGSLVLLGTLGKTTTTTTTGCMRIGSGYNFKIDDDK